MTKITKTQRFEQLKAIVADDAEMVAFLNHEIELLAKKNSAKKAPTKNQVQNADYKATIVNAMETGKLYSVSDVMALADIASNQRATAILTQLVNDGEIVRTVEKRKPYFSLA